VIESALRADPTPDGTCVLVGRAAGKGHDQHPADPFQQGADRFRMAAARCRISTSRAQSSELVQAGRLSLDGIVTDEFGLDDIQPGDRF